MKPRRRIKDPLLGFGWAGYVCAAILFGILAALIAGIDLRYELLKLIQATLGNDAMMLFVVRLPFAAFAISGPAVSVVTGAAILLALKIAPYRVNSFIQILIFIICMGWFLVVVAYSRVVGRAVFGPPQFGFSMSGYFLLEIIGAVLIGILITRLTRSWIVALMWFLAVVAQSTLAIWAMNSGAYYLPYSVVILDAIGGGVYTWFSLAFDLCTMGSLILWAILERKKVFPDRVCQSCGYDLAGLAENAACPECGVKSVT